MSFTRYILRRWPVIAAIVLLLAGCSAGSAPDAQVEPEEPSGLEAAGTAAAQRDRSGGRLDSVTAWAYQLQQIDIDELAASRADLLVIDYAGDEGIPFTPEEIDRLHAAGKIVLSYLSIGEAEAYRPYWNAAWVTDPTDECGSGLSAAAPDWLEPVNPQWCGNYPVAFWDEDWQVIIIDYVDAILAAGFDGVYLDRVDAYEYWLEESEGAPHPVENVPADMVNFIRRIAAYGRQHNPDFVVVPQNGAEIIEYLDEAQVADFLDVIDGIAVEDTFFSPRGGRETGENAPYNPQHGRLSVLAVYRSAGQPVLVVDYLTKPAKIERFVREAHAQGFIPYPGVRELDRLTEIP